MKVRVSGKQLEVGEALPEKVRSRLEVVVQKHFKGGAEASVVFSHEGPGYRADVNTHLDAGVVLKAEGTGPDVYRAFDAMIDHLEKQIRRYKRRLKNHHEKARTPKGASA
jgi:ribosomal subunit interface protein